MKNGNYYYYKIDVVSRSHGYSFMVRSEDELSEDEALERALSAKCFEDEDDLDCAIVDTLIDESDIKAFADSTTTV
jgi:hypothetical protein